MHRYVQYILFSRSKDPSFSNVLTAYANTNFCLGIVNRKKPLRNPDGSFKYTSSGTLHGYITGMYLEPLTMQVEGVHDEICIDLTPLGFCRFLGIPARTFMLDEHILQEVFGAQADTFFEQVFDEPDLNARGLLLERFLIHKLKYTPKPLVESVIDQVDTYNDTITVSQIADTHNCTVKTIHRLFRKEFDISPKEYLRIKRFRKALMSMHGAQRFSQTQLAHDSDFYDQSHYNKEFRFFTGMNPSHACKKISLVNEMVWLGL